MSELILLQKDSLKIIFYEKKKIIIKKLSLNLFLGVLVWPLAAHLFFGSGFVFLLAE